MAPSLVTLGNYSLSCRILTQPIVLSFITRNLIFCNDWDINQLTSKAQHHYDVLRENFAKMVVAKSHGRVVKGSDT